MTPRTTNLVLTIGGTAPALRGGAMSMNAAIALLLLGCGPKLEPDAAAAASEGSEAPQSEAAAAPPAPAPESAPRTATAEFQTVPGVELTGTAKFTAEPDGVRAHVTIDKATPGKHGIHVHEKGDCSDIPGKSMGSHFAPGVKEHGLPSSPARHLGDLGNIEVGADGKGELDIKVAEATLDNGANTYVGKALIIHANEDVGAQPTGNAGDPIACAVIKAD